MDKAIVANVQGEMLFVGCIYKNSDLLLDVDNVINSKYYFSDDVTKFLYDCATILYKKEQKFTEKSISVFMSEDPERLSKYRQCGGYSTISGFMELTDIDDFKTHFETVKKYALLREYENKGFDTTKIRENKKFALASTNEVYHTIKGLVDRVHSEISGQAEVEYITSQMEGFVTGFLESPDMGAITPYECFNELFRGFREGTMFAYGTLSNAGKTRFLVKLAAFNSIIQGHKSMLLLNEMSVDEVKIALLTTVINNPEFQKLHGIKLEKCERELALGIFNDDKGEPVYRTKDKNDNFTESVVEFKSRLMKESREFRDVLLISQWIEENGGQNLAVIDVCTGYTDKDLETHIRKNIRNGYRYFFYDTLKGDDTEGWAAFKKTATLLSELAKENGVFIYNSIQLLDEIENISAMTLNSNHIANAKQIRHVLSSLVLAKEIEPDECKKLRYYPTEEDGQFGVGGSMALPLPESDNPADKLYAFIVSKNRAGDKKKILFKVNLDLNTWIACGYLVNKK
jgi:replicative DNA helicase